MKKQIAKTLKSFLAILLCGAIIAGSISAEAIASDETTVEETVVEESNSSEESGSYEETSSSEESGSYEETSSSEETSSFEEPTYYEESSMPESGSYEENAFLEENSIPTDNYLPVEPANLEEIQPEVQTEVQTEIQTEVQTELQPEVQVEIQPEIQPEVQQGLEDELVLADESNTASGLEVIAELSETLDSAENGLNRNIKPEGKPQAGEEQPDDELQQGDKVQPGDRQRPGDGENPEEESAKEVRLIEGEEQAGVENKPTTTVLNGTLADESLEKNVNYIISGVTEALKTSIESALVESLTSSGNKPLSIVANSLIDADKYSVVYDGYDSKHCWIGAASDVLWVSGWAKYLGFENEDQVMTYITNAFNDSGERQEIAWEWIFDGLHNDDSPIKTEPEATPKKPEVFIPAAINKAVEASGLLTELNIIEELAQKSISAVIEWVDDSTGTFSSSSHAVTVMGLIFDENETNPINRYKSIILVDPDDDGGKSETAPASDDAAYASKLASKNKYTIYKLGTAIVENVTYWTIENYIPGEKSYLTSLASIQNFTEDLLAQITEPEGQGTKNVKDNIDFSIVDGDLHSVHDESGDPKEEFCGEEISLWIYFENTSLNKIDENTKVPVEVEITNTTTNKIVKKTIEGEIRMDVTQLGGGVLFVEIDPILMDLGVGNFTLVANVNPAGDSRIAEAYYVNNKTITSSFVITPSNGGGCIVDGDEGGESSCGTNDNSEDNGNAEDKLESENDNNAANLNTLQYVVLSDENKYNNNIETVETAEFIAAIDSKFENGTEKYYAPSKSFDAAKDSYYNAYVKGSVDNLSTIKLDGIEISKDMLTIITKSDKTFRVCIPANLLKGLTKGIHKIKLYMKDSLIPVEIEIEVL